MGDIWSSADAMALRVLAVDDDAHAGYSATSHRRRHGAASHPHLVSIGPRHYVEEDHSPSEDTKAGLRCVAVLLDELRDKLSEEGDRASSCAVPSRRRQRGDS